MRIRRAAINTTKTLEGFDFNFNPSINRQQVLELATCTYIRQKRNALICGPTGVGKTELAKAVLEGLTFELRLNMDLLKDGGVRVDELRAIGGGARSELWLQLKADICGVPVVAPRITEAASWGAALLAGAAVGHFSSAAEAAEEMLHLDRRFEPNPKRMARYEERYELYREVYPALRSIHHRM